MNFTKPTLGNIDEIPLSFFDCSINNLAAVIASPEANEIVTVKCRHCSTMITCKKFVSAFVACDPCIAKASHDEKMNKLRMYWEHICPDLYRNTLPTHPGFPAKLWESIRKADKSGMSYFITGPSGSCKTRLAFLLLKQALLRGEHVGILWPEKLSTLKSGYNSDIFDRYAAYELLLLDDTLLTACREPKLIDIVKQLLDARMRENRPVIITSQLGAEGIMSGKEYGDLKNADVERVDALVRRMREICAVVQCNKTAFL